jgi:hypothetical protein
MTARVVQSEREKEGTMERDDRDTYADDAPERDEGGDMMPEGIAPSDQRNTESAADKIAGAMEYAVQGQVDTPETYGQLGK